MSHIPTHGDFNLKYPFDASYQQTVPTLQSTPQHELLVDMSHNLSTHPRDFLADQDLDTDFGQFNPGYATAYPTTSPAREPNYKLQRSVQAAEGLLHGTAGISDQSSNLLLSEDPWNGFQTQFSQEQQAVSSQLMTPQSVTTRRPSRPESNSYHDNGLSTGDSGYATLLPGTAYDTILLSYQHVPWTSGHRPHQSMELASVGATSTTYADVESTLGTQQMYTNPGTATPLPPFCNLCGKPTGKTQSARRKHKDRHDKPFKCEVSLCDKDGFATRNDLQRHQESVHNMVFHNTKKFKCFAEACKHGDQHWPRDDNFRTHVKNTHGGESVDRLLALSENWWETEGKIEYGIHARANPSTAFDLENNSLSLPLRVDDPQVRRNSGLLTNPYGMSRTASQGFVNPSHLQHFPEASDTLFDAFGNSSLNTPTPMVRQQSSQSSVNSSSLYGGSSANGRKRNHASMSSQPAKRSPAVPLQRTVESRRSLGVHYEMSPSASNNPVRAFTSLRGGGAVKHRAGSKRPRTVACGESLAHTHSNKNRPMPVLQPVLQSEEDLRAFGTGPANMATQSYAHSTAESVAYQDDMPMFRSMSAQERPLILTRPDPAERTEDRVSGQLREYFLPKCFDPKQIDIIAEYLRKANMTTPALPAAHRSGKLTSPEVGPSLSTSTEMWFKCSEPSCQKRCKRKSELAKHEKRHEKLLFCTFDGCYRRSGSKSDWRRHENDHHMQEECWRCFHPEDVVNGQQCRKLTFEREEYVGHLLKDHKITDKSRQEALGGARRIARRHAGSYWCGFCKTIKATGQGFEANKARFDHIDAHFNSKLTMSDWEDLAGSGQNKRQSRNEHDPANDPVVTRRMTQDDDENEDDNENSQDDQDDDEDDDDDDDV